jgi:hypothetical protein
MVRFSFKESATDKSFGEIIDLDETKYNAIEV